MGLYPFLISRFFVCDPAPVSGSLGVEIITPLYPSAGDAESVVLAVAFHIIQIIHVDSAAAIFDGVADVFGDCDRSAIILLVSASADGKDSAAE